MNSGTPNTSYSTPGTPQISMPDVMVGISPSLSTHFQTTNIAIPTLVRNYASFSPLMNYTGMMTRSPLLEFPLSSSLINISTPYSDKRSKAKKELSAREFNDMFSGKLDSPTKMRTSASIIKRRLQYCGTVDTFKRQSPNTSSSVPCTPVRFSTEISSDFFIDDIMDKSMTPMRFQYRLNQSHKRKAILLRSPLRRGEEAKVSRDLFKNYEDSSQSSYPKVSENLGDFSIHSMHSVVNTSSPVKNASPGRLFGENGQSSDTIFQYVGNIGGLSKINPECLLDCDGTMISVKEVPVDSLMSKKQRMNEMKEENTSHFIM